MIHRLEVRILPNLDPADNLAFEEVCFRSCPPDTVRLLFYRNRPAVVVGRNQNPWMEVNLAAAGEVGIQVARRPSGGGAVYHDAGNLNYSFAMPRRLYDPGRFLGIVTTALGRLGIAAGACRRHSIWVGERKVAGTAFMLTGQRALLHGCILVDADLAALRRLLQPTCRCEGGHAVPSVPSPVVNLCEIASGVAPLDLCRAIEAVAETDLRPATRGDVPEMSPDEVALLAVRNRSWEWLYGRTGSFVLKVGRRPAVLSLMVDQGCVRHASAEPAGLLPPAAAAALQGLRCDGEALAERLRQGDGSAARCPEVTLQLLAGIPTPPEPCRPESHQSSRPTQPRNDDTSGTIRSPASSRT